MTEITIKAMLGGKLREVVVKQDGNDPDLTVMLDLFTDALRGLGFSLDGVEISE